MNISEKINEILHEKRMSKKEFAEILLSLEPKMNRISEIPSLQSIYAYLNGRSSIKADLIPYIAEALDIAEQELFTDTQKSRMKYLKYILKNPTDSELKLIDKQEENKDVKELLSLLQYIPTAMIHSFIKKAKEVKSITLKD